MVSLAQALSAHKKGDLGLAEQLYLGVLKREKLNFDANNLLGTLLCQQRRFADGVPFLAKAVKIRPSSSKAHINLAQALVALERLPEAEKTYREALAIRPLDPAALRGFLRLMARLNRIADADALLSAILAEMPANADILHEAGEFQAMTGRNPAAITSLRRALAVAPNHVAARRRLAICLANDGLYGESMPILEQLGSDPECLKALARALRAAQQSRKALDIALRAERLEPGTSDIHILTGTLLSDLNRRGEAKQRFEAALATGSMTADALYGLSLLGELPADSAASQQLERLTAQPGGDPQSRRLLHFARGHQREAQGKPEEAFAHYAAGRKETAFPFDIARYRAFVDATIGGFPALSPSSEASEQPVFIVGMPRSGTSLVEQIIASHPAAAGAGELEEMRDLARELGFSIANPGGFPAKVASLGGAASAAIARRYLDAVARRGLSASRITDKMPHNFEILGFIASVFPRARILHCERDPADTCVSIFTQNFGSAHGYADDLGTLGLYYREYRRLMKHWSAVLGERMMAISYETLVQSPEPVVRSMLAFLGLPWDDRCLSFHETDRAVTTFSRMQVRQPVHSGSIGRWRRYGPRVSPLLEALGDYAPAASGQ